MPITWVRHSERLTSDENGFSYEVVWRAKGTTNKITLIQDPGYPARLTPDPFYPAATVVSSQGQWIEGATEHWEVVAKYMVVTLGPPGQGGTLITEIDRTLT